MTVGINVLQVPLHRANCVHALAIGGTPAQRYQRQRRDLWYQRVKLVTNGAGTSRSRGAHVASIASAAQSIASAVALRGSNDGLAQSGLII